MKEGPLNTPDPDLDDASRTALVELPSGTALVFGEVPDGLDLIPFTLVSDEDRAALGTALARTTSILGVGGQLAAGLAKTHGLVRLAPETLAALHAGATPVTSGGYNLGVLTAGSSQFSHVVRWLPASEAQAALNAANIGPVLVMLAIQAQLNEITGLVEENLALTETVLKTVRNEQWAELTGLEQAVIHALDEAKAVGRVTPLIWDNVAGYEAAIGKQRDLFRRNVEDHAAELGARHGHQELRRYIDKNGEAMIADLHSLIVAHRSWFVYQALRAGRAQLSAREDPAEAKLLEAIVDNARTEYGRVVGQMMDVVHTFTRELWLLAELPGKQTIPFTGARRAARDVAKMAQQLFDAVTRLAAVVRTLPAPLERPGALYVEDDKHLDKDLSILRWHLDAGEHLLGLAAGRELGTGSVLDALPKTRALRSNEVLVALTERRLLVGDLSDFRGQGLVEREVPSSDIRYVRFRGDDGSGQAELDVITKDDNLTWRFGKGSAAADPLKELAALLAERMSIPDAEREALLVASRAPAPKPRELVA